MIGSAWASLALASVVMAALWVLQVQIHSLRSRVDYAEYQQTTSVFVPLPPRRA